MAFINWSEKLSVKVEIIDEQHKVLIAIINDLQEAMQAGKGKDVIENVLSRLIDYVKMHFGTEEKLMVKYAYPDQAYHKGEHFALTSQVGQLYLKVQAGKMIVTIETMDFLKNWLNNHILKTDVKFGEFLISKGVH